MSLLTLIQNVANEVGLPVPSQVAGSSDSQVKQLLALANREGKQLAKLDWEVLTNEETHTTTAAEDQGALSTIVSVDYDRIKPNTMWNRTQQLPIYGSINNLDWQQRKAVTTTGPTTEFRIRGGNLLLVPAPSAGDTLAFEWVSKYWCQSSGSAGQLEWAADEDTGILDEDLMEMGIIWRFKAAKGLDWEADKIDYVNAVMERFGSDQPAPILNMLGDMRPPFGVAAPEGSWPL